MPETPTLPRRDLLRDRVFPLRRRVGALRRRVFPLRRRVGALRRRVGALRRRVGALRRRVFALRRPVGALRRRVLLPTPTPLRRQPFGTLRSANPAFGTVRVKFPVNPTSTEMPLPR